MSLTRIEQTPDDSSAGSRWLLSVRDLVLVLMRRHARLSSRTCEGRMMHGDSNYGCVMGREFAELMRSPS